MDLAKFRRNREQKRPSKTVIFGREGKTTLELTYSIILNLDSYAKAVAGLQELVGWKSSVPTYAIAL